MSERKSVGVERKRDAKRMRRLCASVARDHTDFIATHPEARNDAGSNLPDAERR